MNNLEETIKQCKICNSTDLTFIENLEHEDIMLSSVDEAIYRIDDVVKCNLCDTIHYLEEDKICVEFNPEIKTVEKPLNYVSDYELAKMQKVC